MRTVLNVIWVIFSGLGLFCSYICAGFVACIFIITMPVGVACFRIAFYVLWPFGRRVIDKPGAGTGSALMNAVWFLVAGIWLVIAHILSAMLLAVTIIGIPLAVANLKLIPVTCFPFGKMIISDSQYRY